MTARAKPAPLLLAERAVLLTAAFLVVALAYLAAFGGGGGHGAHRAFSPASLTLPVLSGMWIAMMVAMMLPPILPWLWFFAAASKEPPSGGVRWGRVVFFASGYFAVWSVLSVFLAFVQLTLLNSSLLTSAHGKVAVPLINGALLVLAGIYQWTPLKSACLRHCRSPLGYFLENWRDGPAGAFSMGSRHGLFCLGCCWALMLLSFAIGIMNAAWMVVITLILCVEKILPGGDAVGRGFGVVLILWGVAFMLFL